MPELPEVETVKKGLELLLTKQQVIIEISKSSKKLRNSLSLRQLSQVKNQKILKIFRKAKYIIFELSDYYIISHLGMTGSWRIEDEQRKHDHIKIHLNDRRILTYNDPRRFGVFDIIKKMDWLSDSRFTHLGIDPVLESQFNGNYLFKITRKSKKPIKNFIMDQSQIVGVGNIYASESLYLAGIHPMTQAFRLSEMSCHRITEAIKETLFNAIECGGTTISDFRQAGGSKGYFQNLLLVYGRENKACNFCNSLIESQMLGGRNTFWCPKCQKV
jgi:formamidopyrimidine-DNA glycosylase